jgi:NADH-quinone oxidoreductase subunit L
MATLVVSVSLITQGYSYWYLASDPALVRFQGYLQLFTAFMLQLVLADNLAVFFLGWEGVGLCSYLLIGF